MSLFGNLFKKKKSESVILIDIGADSVAGAYVHYIEGELPAVLYTRRFPVEVRANEPAETAVVRTLHILNEALIREGAPILARYTGSGRAETVFVSIGAPWQHISLRIERIEQETPFVFTKDIITSTIKETSRPTSEKTIVDESVIGARLNGYETHDPYGKKAHRAEIVILTSLIEERMTKEVVSILRNAYHHSNIISIAGSSLRYQATHRTFPHEREALMLDVMGPETSIALVRKGMFVAMSEHTTTGSWIEQIENELAELAKHYPLPRTIFLLAREQDIPSLQKDLEGRNFEKLRLSDTPPKVVPAFGKYMTPFVRQIDTASPDLSLLLMTLFWQGRIAHAYAQNR